MDAWESLRRASVLGLVVVAIAGMALAVAVDVPCGLDCPHDDDVTWDDALFGAGTGLSPPAFLVPVLVAVAFLGSRRDALGLAAVALQLVLAGVMSLAYFLDTATIGAVLGAYGGAAAGVALLLLLAILATGATATAALAQRRRKAVPEAVVPRP